MEWPSSSLLGWRGLKSQVVVNSLPTPAERPPLSAHFKKGSRMNRNETSRLAVLVGVLAEAYRQTITEATIEAYRIGLRDLTLGAVERAIDEAIRTCRFMPTVSELRALAGVMIPEHRAVLAWRLLMDATKEHCPYHSVDFDDPLIMATLRNLAGGDRAWEVWAEMVEAEEEKWLRRDFERIYVAMAQSSVWTIDGSPLIGFHDRENASRGYPMKDPVNITCGLPPIQFNALADNRSQIALLENIGA